MRAANGVDLYQKTLPNKIVLVDKEYAEQLEQYRHLSGTGIQRLRMLKEIRLSNGEKVTLERIAVELHLAMKYEKRYLLGQKKSLLEKGKTVNDISELLNFPKTTISRYVKKLRGALQESAPVNRCGLPPADRPPESPPAKKIPSA